MLVYHCVKSQCNCWYIYIYIYTVTYFPSVYSNKNPIAQFWGVYTIIYTCRFLEVTTNYELPFSVHIQWRFLAPVESGSTSRKKGVTDPPDSTPVIKSLNVNSTLSVENWEKRCQVTASINMTQDSRKGPLEQKGNAEVCVRVTVQQFLWPSSRFLSSVLRNKSDLCEIRGSHGGVQDGSFETATSTQPTTQRHIRRCGIFYRTQSAHMQHYQDWSHMWVSSQWLDDQQCLLETANPPLIMSMAFKGTSRSVL
jgi:hypothetical protein